jgi:diguanylate cyclase (GGDEF)-like protein
MQETLQGQPDAQQIAAWLAQAIAQRQGCLDVGLSLACKAWDAARQQGFLAEQLEAGSLRAFFQFRRGDAVAMLAGSQQLLPLLRDQGSSALLCELLRWTAYACAEQADFETALAHVTESLARARELADPRLVAIALNATGACLERMGDPWQGARMMREAAVLLGDAASDFELMVSHNNQATIALAIFNLLRHSEQDAHQCEAAEALRCAAQHALAVRPHAQALGDTFFMALSDANRGEALLQLGEIETAAGLLRVALQLSQQHGFTAMVWRVRCLLAELSLLLGRALEALSELDAVLLETAGQAQTLLVLRLHYAAYRAAKLLGDSATALQHLERFQTLERQRSVTQLMAQSRFFVSRLELEQGLGSATPPTAGIGQPTQSAILLAGGDSDAAQLDPLTGLGNRRCFESRMPALVRAAAQNATALTLALIDLDRFKLINEEFGVAVGDQVLQVLAQMLRDNTRGSDLLLRWGGEEILVVLPDTVADRAFEVCERLRQSVEHYPWSQLAPGLDVTLSIGLANAPPYASDLLVARAEHAMLRAKHLGRNRVALA